MPAARKAFRLVGLLIAALVCGDPARAVPGPGIPVAENIIARGDVLAPPPGDRPVVVTARFMLRDISEVDDDAETLGFTGVLVLTWRDPRQSFDPRTAGVAEKSYQGSYQVNELSPAWYPQVVLANESGRYQNDGVVLRILPDGTSTLIETVDAVVEAKFDLHRLPFDVQALDAIFEIVGFDDREVRLEAGAMRQLRAKELRIPQWELEGTSVSTHSRAAPELGADRAMSQCVLRIDLRRSSFFMLRLVVLPLALIVALSWSVFWMDRSSVGDRLSVSFVGILTAVAYQIVVADLLPDVSYLTLMHGFLNVSFVLMSATVPINLLVGSYDKAGEHVRGDAIDRRCRWLFPLVYSGSIALMVIAAHLFF